LLLKASITLGILKQSAIEWSYTYKPPNSTITYNVQNTCSLDTNLQMIYFLWIRGYISNAVIETDSLLLKTIHEISIKEYNKARHDVIVKRAVPHKVERDGDIESWDCEGDLKDSKPFQCLFKSNGPIQLTWGDCTQMGEKCPYHDFYQYKSTSKMHASKPRKICLLMHPDKSIPDRVLHEFGVCLVPCQREFLKNDAFTEGTKVDYNEFRPCPENGMRRTANGSSYDICPWVITFTGTFPTYTTLNDIPQTFLFPPETLYSLASVILYSGRGGHYIGISLDAKSPRGVHVSYDGMHGMAKRVQPIRLDDPKFTRGFMISELWYVKVESSAVTSRTETSKIPSTPSSAPLLYASIKPAGLHNFGNTCYLNTLLQIIFWLVPIRKRLIEYNLSKKDLDKIPSVCSSEFEADNKKLYKGLESLKKVQVSLKISMTKKRPILKDQIKKMLDFLGLSSFENKCVNEMWINLFHHYFEYIGFDCLYNVQMTTYNREILEPNKTGKPRESKHTRLEPLLSVNHSDIQK
jgi:hypothetical protein